TPSTPAPPPKPTYSRAKLRSTTRLSLSSSYFAVPQTRGASSLRGHPLFYLVRYVFWTNRGFYVINISSIKKERKMPKSTSRKPTRRSKSRSSGGFISFFSPFSKKKTSTLARK